MNHRSIYVYPWDVEDAAKFCNWAVESNLTAITVATSYHAGKFIRPAPVAGPRVIFPEDGTIYFQPNLDNYGEILPKVANVTEDRDVLAELCTQKELKIYGWTVLLHNTRLGFLHPDKVVRNAFGDPYPYSLCPSNSDVREYATSLCADLSLNYSIDGLSIETPGFLPFAHGYHHEFSQIAENRWLNHMLGLCFCDHCVSGAQNLGIDAAQLRATIGQKIDTHLRIESEMNSDELNQLLMDDLETISGLSDYIEYRCETVTSLVAEIKGAMRSDCDLFVIPTTDRPTKNCWIEGSDLAKLAQVATGIEVPFYETTVTQVFVDAREVREISGQEARIRGILRSGNPDFNLVDDVVSATIGLADKNIEGISYYNYGLMRQSDRDAISVAADAAKNIQLKGNKK